MDADHIMHSIMGRTPKILGSEKYSEFAIFVPLIEVDGETHILFEVRSFNMRRQPGEICFPGGKIDRGDRDAEGAALRETSEELGIDRKVISAVQPLDYLVSPFGTIIYPFAGILNVDVKDLDPNKAEVEEIFTSPLRELQMKEPELYNIEFKMEPEKGFPYENIPGGENYNFQARNMKEHFYYYEDKVIWGLTARILHHFIELISDNK